MTCRVCGAESATKRRASGPARFVLCAKHLSAFLASTFGARYKAGQAQDAQVCAWVREQSFAVQPQEESSPC